MSYQVLARKWRPHNFDQMVGQEAVLQMHRNALNNQRLHHAYIYTGTRGVGKTSLGRIFAKCLNCETRITATPCDQCSACLAIDAGRFLDLLEIDAASKTKVEDTRELLENVQYPPVQGRFKIFLIDEVHMLSGHSFNALLKTLEEPPEHVKFLLATTDPKRLPITILSRCLQFHLKRVPKEQIEKQLVHICNAENIPFELEGLSDLSEAADGSLRDALSLLDQAIAYGNQSIKTLEVRRMLGNVEKDCIYRILEALSLEDSSLLLKTVQDLNDLTPDYQQTLAALIQAFHQMSLLQIATDISDIDPTLMTLSKQFSAEDLQLYYQIALIGRRDLSLSPNPKQGFEMIMLRMLAFRPSLMPNTAKTQSAAAPAIKPASTYAPPPKTIAPKETPKIPEKQAALTTPTQENSDNPWTPILKQLNLSGMALAFAANCALKELSQDKIILQVSKKHEPMLSPKLTTSIENELKRHFNRDLHLKMEITETELQTSAKDEEKQKQLRKASAVDAMQQNPAVQHLVNLFDATLDIDSVEPNAEV